MFEVEIDNIKIKTKIGVSVSERKKEQLLCISIKFIYNPTIRIYQKKS